MARPNVAQIVIQGQLAALELFSRQRMAGNVQAGDAEALAGGMALLLGTLANQPELASNARMILSNTEGLTDEQADDVVARLHRLLMRIKADYLGSLRGAERAA